MTTAALRPPRSQPTSLAPRSITRAGFAFAAALVIVFAILTIVIVASLRSIDDARARADRIDALATREIAASVNQKVAFRQVLLYPNSRSAQDLYASASRDRDAVAAQMTAAGAPRAAAARIAASEAAFTAWETEAEALIAQLRIEQRAASEAETEREAVSFAAYSNAAANIRPGLNTFVQEYRSELARRLFIALGAAGLFTLIGIGLVIVWVRSGTRGARALESSRDELAIAHAEISKVAERLQAAMLGSSTSANPAVAAAARYQPAERILTVGGDWYDIIDLDGGSVACIIGDVVGHGIDAAATMGQLRALVAGLMIDGFEPSATLKALDAFAARVPNALNATCLIAIVDPEGETLRWARAGHPPLLLLDADGGQTFLLEPGGPPVGARRRLDRTTATIPFPRGSTLVLYTDGLIERRDEPINVGLDRLARMASLASSLPVDALCEHLIEACGNGERFADDIVTIACRALEQPSRQFSYELPADLEELQPLRHELQRWLAELDATPEVTRDVVLAVNEIVTNSVEHGYGHVRSGIVTVTGTHTGDTIALRVVDHGSWRVGHDDPSRGRGAAIARTCMDDVTFERRPEGTTVSMRRALHRESIVAAE